MTEKTAEVIDLAERHCTPCEGETPPMAEEEAGRLLAGLDNWERIDSTLNKSFRFKTYGKTIAFVNAVAAWIAQRENHHPDLRVGYNTCQVTYTTHAIDGLSETDFICAAKVDALLR